MWVRRGRARYICSPTPSAARCPTTCLGTSAHTPTYRTSLICTPSKAGITHLCREEGERRRYKVRRRAIQGGRIPAATDHEPVRRRPVACFLGHVFQLRVRQESRHCRVFATLSLERDAGLYWGGRKEGATNGCQLRTSLCLGPLQPSHTLSDPPKLSYVTHMPTPPSPPRHIRCINIST